MRSLCPDLRATFTEDGAAILDIERDTISTLNSTGAYVWQALQRGESLELIIDNLARNTGHDIALIERDVQEFVTALTQTRLFPC